MKNYNIAVRTRGEEIVFLRKIVPGGADRSYAWVIYPDGRTQKAPVAYWNKRHIEPMPGSLLFVGFADSLWTNKYEALNADILRSLSQRRPE